jgi:hypothetical protein
MLCPLLHSDVRLTTEVHTTEDEVEIFGFADLCIRKLDSEEAHFEIHREKFDATSRFFHGMQACCLSSLKDFRGSERILCYQILMCDT